MWGKRPSARPFARPHYAGAGSAKQSIRLIWHSHAKPDDGKYAGSYQTVILSTLQRRPFVSASAGEKGGVGGRLDKVSFRAFFGAGCGEGQLSCSRVFDAVPSVLSDVLSLSDTLK
jgi:hypothetical protein